MSVQLFCSMVEARAISGVATAQEQNVEPLCSLLLMLVARLMREPDEKCCSSKLCNKISGRLTLRNRTSYGLRN